MDDPLFEQARQYPDILSELPRLVLIQASTREHDE